MRLSPIIALAAGAALSAGSALAGEASDGPMATAGGGMAAPPSAEAAPPPARAAAPPLSTAEQIEQFLAAAPAADEDGEPLVPAERRVRGEVAVGVGSHGYRSVYGRAEIPIGKSGTVTVAAEQSRGRGLYARCPGGFYDGWAGPADPYAYSCSPYLMGPRPVWR